MDIIIGIGEFAISDNPQVVIKTFALGSCIAVVMQCPQNGVLGMAHIALPSSEINREESNSRPGYYADTAIALLLDRFMNKYKCRKSHLLVSIFGGANSSNLNDVFKVGERNVEAVKGILQENSIQFHEEETGGSIGRSIEASVFTGKVNVNEFDMGLV